MINTTAKITVGEEGVYLTNSDAYWLVHWLMLHFLSFLIIFRLFVLYVWMFVLSVCIMCMPDTCWGSKEVIRFLGTWILGDCKPPSNCWELIPGHLEEQQMLLTDEPPNLILLASLIAQVYLPRVVLSTVGCRRQSSIKIVSRMAIGQSNQENSSTEILSSQVTLDCIKLTVKTKSYFLGSIYCRHGLVLS